MPTLWITSRRYSSWSMRGWLAARASGLPIEVAFVDIHADDWPERRVAEPFARAGGKVPVLVDGEAVIWNALGIVEWLDRASGGTRFWPRDGAARAFAWSAAAEMQASFMALRRHCPMNMMRRYPGWQLNPEARPDIERVTALWETGLARFGGPWLAGADWDAVDLMYAPVASRLTTYDVALPPAAEAYRARSLDHPLVAEWAAEAARETTLNPAYEF